MGRSSHHSPPTLCQSRRVLEDRCVDLSRVNGEPFVPSWLNKLLLHTHVHPLTGDAETAHGVEVPISGAVVGQHHQLIQERYRGVNRHRL